MQYRRIKQIVDKITNIFTCVHIFIIPVNILIKSLQELHYCEYVTKCTRVTFSGTFAYFVHFRVIFKHILNKSAYTLKNISKITSYQNFPSIRCDRNAMSYEYTYFLVIVRSKNINYASFTKHHKKAKIHKYAYFLVILRSENRNYINFFEHLETCSLAGIITTWVFDIKYSDFL